ncbi:(2Fe-2S)-binding protein [Arsenicicoccus cauae]|uniref:(2Fe-2S)-binding protein n=1 Tax=Arsenicicoccus cauae TaxID=2663847 RepID=UPI00370D8950
MGHPLTGGELELACDLVSSRIAWLNLLVGPGDAASGPTVDTAEVGSGSPAGLQALADWRSRVEAGWARLYGRRQPPHVAATFVLGWYLDALAHPAAFAAAIGPWALDLSPGSVVIEPHPTQGYPARVHVSASAAHQVLASEPVRLRRAEESYRHHAEQVARSYAAPGVKMSSRQRLGMVDDLWRIAVERAAAAAGSPLLVRPDDDSRGRLRASCCFIYALPGATTCSTCPRRARATPSTRRSPAP